MSKIYILVIEDELEVMDVIVRDLNLFEKFKLFTKSILKVYNQIEIKTEHLI